MLLALAALAAPPISAPLISAEDRARIDRREVVVHQEIRETGASVVAFVLVQAPRPVVIDAVLDLEALQGRVRGLSDVEVYLREDDRVGVTVHASSFGKTWTYHAIYVADRAAATVHYTLDPERPGDFTQLDGWYRAYADPGGTLLVNESTGDTAGWVPAWIKRWFAERSRVDTLSAIRAKAEAS